jgi:hypothetical protein
MKLLRISFGFLLLAAATVVPAAAQRLAHETPAELEGVGVEERLG